MMRGGLISMLYSKATDVQLTEVDTSSSLTLMSADIERIVTGMETGHEVRSSELRFELELIQTLNKGLVECIRDCLGHVSS
jgi:ATP-binding cassette subfamily C (CFTR/MRP) protein 1